MEMMRREEEAEERGRYLYRLRLLRGMTMQEAADRMRISKSTLCRYESGVIYRMSARVFKAVCEIYGVTSEELESRRMPVTGQKSGTEVRKRGISEDEILHLYRELDLRQQLRVQFLLEQGRYQAEG